MTDSLRLPRREIRRAGKPWQGHCECNFPGVIYHVTSRMVGSWRAERSRLFGDQFDHERFLGQLADRVKQYRIRLYQFNLMANHFHLVCETPEANLSEFMQSLATAYTVYFNLRHVSRGSIPGSDQS